MQVEDEKALMYRKRIVLLKRTLRSLVPALEKCEDGVSIENVQFVLAQDDILEKQDAEENAEL